MRDCVVYSGALCEGTSATAPGSAFEFPPCIRYKLSPFHSPEDGEEGGRAEGLGGWRGLLKGSLQSGLANDNRCKFVSSRALEGCRLRHTYCKRGIAPCVRVHFVRTQVQLPLDQMEVCRKRVCEDTNAADLGSNIEFIDRDQRA